MAVLGLKSLSSPTALLDGRRGFHESASWLIDLWSGSLEYSYTGGSGTVTALNITGSGILTFCAFGSSSTSTSATLDIEIDGVSVLSDSAVDIRYNTMLGVGSIYKSGSLLSTNYDFVPFNSSLEISVSCNVDAYMAYNYYLT